MIISFGDSNIEIEGLDSVELEDFSHSPDNDIFCKILNYKAKELIDQLRSDVRECKYEDALKTEMTIKVLQDIVELVVHGIPDALKNK